MLRAGHQFAFEHALSQSPVCAGESGCHARRGLIDAGQ
jgi:hypothetical protein